MNLDRFRLASLPRLLWMGLLVAGAAAPMPAAAQGLFSVDGFRPTGTMITLR